MITEAQELIDRTEAAWHEGNATEPGMMVLADVVADLIRWLIRWLELEADDREAE